MSKLTLLDLVQDIANDLETDDINSINDTVESAQIAQIVKSTYFEMLANRNWPHLRQTIKMDSSGSSDRPTHMKLPTNVKEVLGIAYNKQRSATDKKRYEYLLWMEPEEFLYITNQRNTNNPDIEVVTDIGGIEILLKNDTHPQYYTSFDNAYIVCDSYNSDVDSTLQSSKTQMIAYVTPSWTHADDFIPDLPEEAFPALLEEAKSTAFVVVKQQANEKAEQKASRQHRWLSRKAWRVKGGVEYPNYGRKRHASYMRKNPHFNRDFTV